MGGYVWFAKLYKDKTVINFNGTEIIYPRKSNAVFNKNSSFYLLDNDRIIIYNNYFNKEILTLDNSSNQIFIDDKIYVSGEDSGAVSTYTLNGKILDTIKFGEHISDFVVFDKYLYVLTYHDNFLIKANSKKINNKIKLNYFPQRILKRNYIYVLLNNEFYSFIKMFDYDLNFIKSIRFKRQIGDIFIFKNKIVFNGDEYNYILNENLTLISQKNSTGKFLCKCSDIPILEDNKILDVINNVIYPL